MFSWLSNGKIWSISMFQFQRIATSIAAAGAFMATLSTGCTVNDSFRCSPTLVIGDPGTGTVDEPIEGTLLFLWACEVGLVPKGEKDEITYVLPNYIIKKTKTDAEKRAKEVALKHYPGAEIKWALCRNEGAAPMDECPRPPVTSGTGAPLPQPPTPDGMRPAYIVNRPEFEAYQEGREFLTWEELQQRPIVWVDD